MIDSELHFETFASQLPFAGAHDSRIVDQNVYFSDLWFCINYFKKPQLKSQFDE